MSITLDTSVPYGNACNISITRAKRTAVVAFSPDPHGGPEVLWFCFRLKRTGRRPKSPGKVRLVLENMTNMLGGDNPANMRPVAAGPDRDWKRLASGQGEEMPDGRINVTWTINEPADFIDIAFCYPYGPPEVEALVAETNGFYRADTIGVSQAARPIVRLSNAPGEPDGERPGLYLIARQHSGETPGSWVLDGFLRHLATLNDKAPLVWSVPLTNIDGVESGDYGKDNFPYDLNRAWGQAPMRHEVLVIQRDMRRWKARCKPTLAIDFHAPGACETDGVYAYVDRPKAHVEQLRTSRRWARVFAETLGPDYAAKDFARVADYPSRWETPAFKDFCANDLGVTALSLETPYALSAEGRVLLTRKRYREAGARLAAAVADAGGH